MTVQRRQHPNERSESVVSFEYDNAYKHRMAEVITKAIFEAAIVEHDGVRTSVLRSGELVDAMIMVQALLISTSPAASVPGRLRTWCERYAKRMGTMVREMQANPQAREMFEVISDDVLH
jgi:hypothetical protein